MGLVFGLAALLAGVAAGGQVPAPPESGKIAVMVLGTYHFGNPGRDVVNMKADDVTSPRRQRELERLADTIAAFRPTRVMVEQQEPGPDYAVPAFRAFKPGDLLTKRDETVQIGYRVAARAGLKDVQGIDEQPGPGEPDYFPVDALEAYARDKGQLAAYQALFAPYREAAARMEARQGTDSIAALLADRNAPDREDNGMATYYRMLAFGDGDRQPGAVLNAMWYMRNAKIFSKLMNVATPGDRILVVYGAGHAYWLRHFAAETPGFVSVDVMPYLKRAAQAR